MRILGIGVLAAAAAALLSVPGLAAGQTPASPFAPGLPQQPIATQSTTTPVVQASTSSAAGSGGISGTGAIMIAVGAVVVLGGISLYIWRDARRRAPVRGHAAAATAGAGGRAGAKARTKPRKLSPAERRRRKRGRAR